MFLPSALTRLDATMLVALPTSCARVCLCVHAAVSVRLRRPVPPHLHTWVDVWATQLPCICPTAVHLSNCRASVGASPAAGKRPSLVGVAEPPGLAKAAGAEDADATGDSPSEEVDGRSGGGSDPVLADAAGAHLPLHPPFAMQTRPQVLRGAPRSGAHAHLAGRSCASRSLRPSVVVMSCVPLHPMSAHLQATLRRRMQPTRWSWDKTAALVWS
jgi:hypothetical protein